MFNVGPVEALTIVVVILLIVTLVRRIGRRGRTNP
jgi:uncharacterized membrane protein